mmetsp:Transcript_29201/g.44146  ORF Transcript_29201/g.44146 Transcript_29201/m.44146 type:complete len:106 (+) Transcript_29201:205-522(+)
MVPNDWSPNYSPRVDLEAIHSSRYNNYPTTTTTTTTTTQQQEEEGIAEMVGMVSAHRRYGFGQDYASIRSLAHLGTRRMGGMEGKLKSTWNNIVPHWIYANSLLT